MNDVISAKAAAVESTVRAFYAAFSERRREDAEELVAAEFSFTSPYDDAIDRAEFFARCWPGGDRFVHFEVERLCPTESDAFVTYWGTLDNGVSFRNTEFLTVEDGKIVSAEVYFGASYRDGKFVPQQPPNDG
ncbi:MAG TPA: nuclear transport factor 2 family protein [Candidatus Elarobacter sp.]|jgi:hypothetical protein